MSELTHLYRFPKFIEIYFNFDEKERKKFKKLALSTYFNTKRDYKLLIKEINKIKPDIDPVKINLSRHLLDKTGLTERALWNRLSELTHIAEYFLILSKAENDKLLHRSLLMDELEERKLEHVIDLYRVSSIKLAEETKVAQNTYFNIHSIFNNISINFSEINNYKASVKFHTLQSEYSMLHFLLLLFKQALELELQEKNNLVVAFSPAKEIISKLDHTSLLANIRRQIPGLTVPVDIYYYLYLAFKDSSNEENYFSAKNIFLKDKELFTPDFKNDIYQALRNYCIDKTNKGKGEFYKEIFALNKSIIEEGLFTDLNVVNSQTNNFRNFIFAALRLNEFDWIKNFIDAFSKELPDEIREDEINLSKGILSLYEKKYSEALVSLSKVKRRRYLQYLDTSVYKLIIFYETSDIEECYKESARLKNYILKHKDIPVYLKGSYQRFIKKYELLLKLSEKPEKTDIEFFIDDIKKTRYIGLGGWLYEKSTELLTKTSKRN